MREKTNYGNWVPGEGSVSVLWGSSRSVDHCNSIAGCSRADRSCDHSRSTVCADTWDGSLYAGVP